MAPHVILLMAANIVKLYSFNPTSAVINRDYRMKSGNKRCI